MKNRKERLPYSEQLPITKLASIFDNTTNSYKYLFLLGLLNQFEKKYFLKNTLDVIDIYTEMLIIAWYPHSYFKLNFGDADQIGNLLDRIDYFGSQNSIFLKGFRSELHDNLREYTKDITNTLDRYVKFRLLRIFFKKELRGVKDSRINQKIKELAVNNLEEYFPLYFISTDESKIIIHPLWKSYISGNISILRDFVAWKWLGYMQKRNQMTSNLHLKLFPPQKRESLSFQTNLWKKVLGRKHFFCIYSGEKIDPEYFSLDHFLPWSYFAHDELYNLTPTMKEINSSKSNMLPDFDQYLYPLIEQQYDLVNTGSIVLSNESDTWKRVKNSYQNSLQIREESVFHEKTGFSSILEDHYKASLKLAENQGFHSKWKYTITQ